MKYINRFIATAVYCILFLCIPISLKAENKIDTIKITKRNIVFAEIIGNSPYLYNLGYERQIEILKHLKTAATFGIQYFASSTSKYTFSISPQISFLIGNINNFEIGCGLTQDMYYKDEHKYFFRVGYRYQSMNGFMFKVAWTPYISDTPTLNVLYYHWGGIGFGYNF